jgi:hypothetical protein
VIRLYDRDARDVASLLELMAARRDARTLDPGGGNTEIGRVATWRPGELEQIHSRLMIEHNSGALSAARIKELRAAITEQVPAQPTP